ncbi:MAG TPA: YaaL family protein [Candidatus Copromonas faecavium]|uniref:YaaL family protein n=1 Tax=Candidatus Copromonas faecavium (nom. illeg.) TaxID=2840740 RepID=A0A9D1A7C9_9FIRM|nr:YaaL family protein [Candidatus Copromonas faecavium]
MGCIRMLFASKKNAFSRERKREISELIRQIELSKTAILSAQNQFEQVVDPTLIDCYIYELNAAQLRYQFLLRNLKKRELQEV